MDTKALVQSFIEKSDPVDVTLTNGDVVTVRKFKVKDIPLISGLLVKLQKFIADRSAKLEEEYAKLKEAGDEEGLRAFAKDTEGNMNLIVTMVTDNLDDVAGVLASVTGLSIDRVMDLELDELAALCMGVVLLNKDFFTQKVLPALMKILGQAPKLTKTK